MTHAGLQSVSYINVLSAWDCMLEDYARGHVFIILQCPTKPLACHIHAVKNAFVSWLLAYLNDTD